MEGCDLNVWNVFNQHEITIPCWAIYFQGVGARVSLKVASKGSRKGQKVWKFRFLGCFSKSKMEEWDQNVWNIFYQFYITILCSTTYFVEVHACVLLKVDTKGSPRGKKSSENVDF